ncbi:hypothetical protein FACS1894189_5680 [Planctomycetales bacterium]|nr:hypothetical protein FACS1894189_5680 [Planctomycetales bacterium]
MPKGQRGGKGDGKLLFCNNMLRITDGFDSDRQFMGVDEERNDFAAGGFSGWRIAIVPSSAAKDRTAQAKYKQNWCRLLCCQEKIGSDTEHK